MKKLFALTLAAAFVVMLAAPIATVAVPPPNEVPPEECMTGVDGAAQMTCDPSVPNEDEPGKSCSLVDVHIWKIKKLDGGILIVALCDYGECGVEKPQS